MRGGGTSMIPCGRHVRGLAFSLNFQFSPNCLLDNVKHLLHSQQTHYEYKKYLESVQDSASSQSAEIGQVSEKGKGGKRGVEEGH
jgi:hypothetical protein